MKDWKEDTNKEWKEVRLGDLVKLNESLKNKDFIYDTIEYFDTSSVTEGIFSTPQIIPTLNAPSRAKRIIKKNDIIISTVRPNLKHFGFIKEVNPNTVVSTGYVVISCKKINAKFLYYFLTSNFVTEYLSLISENQTSTYPSFNPELIQKIKISYPENAIYQQRIAAILSAYDELIEVNTERIKVLEQTARELYKEWFVRMRFPGYQATKFSKGVPEGWEIVRIDTLYKTSSGGTPSREQKEYYENGIHNWIKTGELLDSFILETNEKISDLGLKKSSAKLFPKYTTIFAMYGNTIGQLGITSQEAATNQACCALLPLTKEFDFEFIFLTLLLNREIIISFGMGAAQQNVSQDELKKFKILKPTKDIALKFKELTNSMFMQIQMLQQQNTELRQIRDRLLPRLISGKLQVKAEAMI